MSHEPTDANGPHAERVPPPAAETAADVTPAQVESHLLHRVRAAEAELADARWQLMRFLAFVGRPLEGLALATRNAAATDDPEEKAACYLAMGQLVEQAGDAEAAIRVYGEALRLEPSTSRTWYLIHNNLGYCLNQVGRHEEAESFCRRAVAIDPARHNAFKNLAIAEEALGRFAEAARHYLEAIDLEPADPRALDRLERLLQQHPEIAPQIEGLDARLAACRAEVEQARSRARLPKVTKLRAGEAPPA